MIAIGGVIGAGFFVGSGVVIRTAGPAAFLTYALCGVLIILVMRMLGEMATANPSTGSFADYARVSAGRLGGFLGGLAVLVLLGHRRRFRGRCRRESLQLLGQCAVVAGRIDLDADDDRDQPVLRVVLRGVRILVRRNQSRRPSWCSSLLATLFVLGLWPGRHLDFSNLTAHDGFFPHGVGGVFAAIVVVIFSMVGAEVATIAAGETANPERAIQRATNAVAARIAIFFVGSVFLLVVILPWNSVVVGASPYVAALKHIGIPGADHIMNAIVLTAVLSCLNSGLYTGSRMLFVLAARREAPAQLLKVSGRGVPYVAIMCSSVVGFMCVIMAWVAPGSVFTFLLNSSGAIVLFVYLLIALSQIVLRFKTPPEKLQVKMWYFPVLSFLTLAAIAGVLVQMAFNSTARGQFWLSLLSWAVVVVLYFLTKRWRGPVTPESESTGRELRA